MNGPARPQTRIIAWPGLPEPVQPGRKLHRNCTDPIKVIAFTRNACIMKLSINDNRASGDQGLKMKMAYMNQEKKAKIAAQLKKVVPSSWKYSLAVRNHSIIVMTIKQAPVDLVAAYLAKGCSDEVRTSCIARGNVDVNPYHWAEHFEEGEIRDTFEQIFDALNIDNFDKSDLQTDYFHVGHYVDVDLGKWNKPFVVG